MRELGMLCYKIRISARKSSTVVAITELVWVPPLLAYGSVYEVEYSAKQPVLLPVDPEIEDHIGTEAILDFIV